MSEQSSGNLSFDERFQIITDIGSGYYGDVFKAFDNNLNRFVALKKIRVFNEEDGLPTAFYREIGALNQISHPNIITLYDTVRNDDNELFLNMEYCEYDLQAVISTHLTPSQCLSYFTQICHGISYLHQQDIIHRDLKPANILVNSNQICKITDFGLSRKMTTDKTKPFTPRVGSGSYRAPEIIAGTGDYDSAIDIWALGCILFQMVSKNCKRFIPGGHDDYLELHQILSIYGPSGIESLSQFPTFAPFLSTYTSKNNSSLSSYLYKQISSQNHWAIPFLEQMLQLNPKMRPNITSILDALSSISISDPITLPYLDIIETHGTNVPFKNKDLFQSLSKYDISPPRLSPFMIPIYA